MTKFNVGDKLYHFGFTDDFFKEGGSYEIISVSDNGVDVIDDTGGEHLLTIDFIPECFKLVTESTEGTSVEASPSVIDLLSNLALRLTKVEADMKPTDDNDRPTQSDTADNVNSPQHYRHGRFETIELIEDITKKYDDGFVAYCVGNAVKYVDRAPFKHGSPSEDLRKAAWYLTRAAEHTDGKGAQ